MTYLRKISVFFIFLFLFDFLFCLEPNKNQKKESQQTNIINIDIEKTIYSRILAGVISPQEQLPEEKYNKLIQSKTYENHYKEMQKAWQNTENIRLNKMKEWAKVELSSLCRQEQTMFYPFSGPDILNAEILFPCSKEYILFGLEPPGQLTDISTLSDKDFNRYLYFIRDSLRSILSYSFFRTNDMKINFFKELDGVEPAILTFLAYNQNEIVRITPVELNQNGIVENRTDSNAIKGIRIYFINKNTDIHQTQKVIKTVTYFQVDISNNSIKDKNYFFDVLKSKAPYITFLKAASYLMHNDSFSMIRDFIIENSSDLIQDDSGIPLKYFNPTVWKLTFYGSYTSPIDLFKNRLQPDLKKIYNNKNEIKPLPFGTGYNFYPGTSNLMIANKTQSK